MEFEARTVDYEDRRKRSELSFDHVNVEHQDFSGRKLDVLAAMGSTFHGCTFEDMRVENAMLGVGMDMSEYVDCSFDRSRLDEMGNRVRFVRCSFRHCDIRDARCFTAEFIDCVFSGVMRRSFFNGTVPADKREELSREHNEFHGNDFSQMKLIDVSFRTGIDLTKQRLPVGEDYLYLPHAPSTLARAKEDVLAWAPSELRKFALSFIRTLESELTGGQEQSLIRESDWAKGKYKDSKLAVIGLLRRHNADE